MNVSFEFEFCFINYILYQIVWLLFSSFFWKIEMKIYFFLKKNCDFILGFSFFLFFLYLFIYLYVTLLCLLQIKFNIVSISNSHDVLSHDYDFYMIIQLKINILFSRDHNLLIIIQSKIRYLFYLFQK